jgi:Bacterial export proteins, family 1
MEEAALLAALPTLAFQAVLIFARLGATAMVLPGLGEQEVPPMLRLALGLALVALVLPGMAPGLPGPPDSVAEAVRLLGIEALAGLWLGGLACCRRTWRGGSSRSNSTPAWRTRRRATSAATSSPTRWPRAGRCCAPC